MLSSRLHLGSFWFSGHSTFLTGLILKFTITAWSESNLRTQWSTPQAAFRIQDLFPSRAASAADKEASYCPLRKLSNAKGLLHLKHPNSAPYSPGATMGCCFFSPPDPLLGWLRPSVGLLCSLGLPELGYFQVLILRTPKNTCILFSLSQSASWHAPPSLVLFLLRIWRGSPT